MIKSNDLYDALDVVRQEFPTISEKDICFLILCDNVQSKDLAYHMAYGTEGNGTQRLLDKGVRKLAEGLKMFGIGNIGDNDVSRGENKAELIMLLQRIKQAVADGELEAKDALKMEADIRVKLNDKFDMEEDDANKHIIVVPSKHDMICPHTNRECTYMPTKKACMDYYNLNEG